MKSPMIQAATYIVPSDKDNYSELQVLMSAAGFYVGTLYNDPDCGEIPGSRDSEYFAHRAEAEAWLYKLELGKVTPRMNP